MAFWIYMHSCQGDRRNVLKYHPKDTNKIVQVKKIIYETNELISPSCRINASVNWVSIGSDNGLFRIQRQAFI